MRLVAFAAIGFVASSTGLAVSVDVAARRINSKAIDGQSLMHLRLMISSGEY